MNCLNENYSTTKRVTTELPNLIVRKEERFNTVLTPPVDSNRKGEGGLRRRGYFKKNDESSPLVSIVSVVYNGEKYLEETILSVLNQGYDNIEYIIVDGGSTDGTLDIVKKYELAIDYWVSEPDKGIYDAMNKGLRLATGKYVGFINADDYYVEGAVEKAVFMLQKSRKDYFIGAAKKVPSNLVAKPIAPLQRGAEYQGMMYSHNGAFIPLAVYKQVGLFNLEYKIAADFDMALRIHLSGYEAVSSSDIVVVFREGGASDTIKSKYENLQIAIKHGRPKVAAYMSFFINSLKHIVALILPKSLLSKIYEFKRGRFRYEN